jgi:hypothetical protein
VTELSVSKENLLVLQAAIEKVPLTQGRVVRTIDEVDHYCIAGAYWMEEGFTPQELHILQDEWTHPDRETIRLRLHKCNLAVNELYEFQIAFDTASSTQVGKEIVKSMIKEKLAAFEEPAKSISIDNVVEQKMPPQKKSHPLHYTTIAAAVAVFVFVLSL